MHLAVPFGNVTNIQSNFAKNEALVEMESEKASLAMVNYFSKSVVSTTDRQFQVQMSSLKEIKKTQYHSSTILSSYTLLKALQSESLEGVDAKNNKSHNGAMPYNSKFESPSMSKKAIRNAILRVTIENTVYPVTIDILYEVFSRAGKVLKISMIERKDIFQALIQYASPVIAEIAKLSLDGTHIYNGCCLLKIEDSNLTDISIKQSGDNCREYTCPSKTDE